MLCRFLIQNSSFKIFFKGEHEELYPMNMSEVFTS